MKWNVLRYARWGVDFLITSCFMALFYGWIYLAAFREAGGGGNAFFWFLFSIAIFTRYSVHYFQLLNVKIPLPQRKIFNLLLISIYFVIIFLTLVIIDVDLPFNPLMRFALGILTWFWAVKSGSELLEMSSLHRQLFWGAFSHVSLVFVSIRMDLWAQISHQIIPFIIFWLLGIILAITLNRILNYAHENTALKGNTVKFWSPLASVIAFLCLFTALLLSIIMPAFLRIFSGPARFLMRGLGVVLDLILYGLSYVVYLAFILLSRIFRDLEFAEQAPEVPQIEWGLPEQEFITEETVTIGEGIIQWSAIIIFLIVIGVIAFSYLMIAKKRNKPQDNDEIRESFASLSALAKWSKDGLKSISKKTQDFWRQISKSRNFKTATQIYNGMLLILEQKGLKRFQSSTPYHFQTQIKSALKEGHIQADAILEAFILEFYAGQTIEPPEISKLFKDLQTLKNLIRKQ